MQDGARNAFTGYLYQFLGVASLRARAITASNLDGELAIDLVASIDNGQLVHEVHGQDAVIKVQPGGNDESVAIQFKHARTHDRMTIEPSELIEILHAFDRSFKEAQTRGESLDRFVLVTNRKFDENSQDLYDQRSDVQVPAKLVPKVKTRAGKTVKKAEPIIKEYGTAAAAGKAWHAVLKKLSVWPQFPYEAAIKRLRELATRHGLSSAEFDAARSRIISSIIQATVLGPLEITSEWLTGCLVDAPDAHVLHLSSPEPTTRSVAGESLKKKLTEVVRDDRSLVRRRLIDEAIDQVRQFPVVWLTGDGGCGKSVLGLQLLMQESSTRLALFLSGGNATHDTCLAEALRPIRSERHAHMLPLEAVSVLLDRVCIANADELPPLILVDVDGLDEVPESERHRLRPLIDMFFKRQHAATANAVLVLTCRAPERDQTRAVQGLVSSWFDTELPDMIAARVGAVHVSDFDDDELREAADVLADDVRRRIDDMLALNHPSDQMGNGLQIVGSDRATPRDLSIIDSLRQPAMWGEFASLSPTDRLSALSGDGTALATMADQFVTRFCLKTIRRRATFRSEQVRDGLVAISAARSEDLVVQDRQAHWVRPAMGPLNRDEAAILYSEGLSYGLIREDAPGRWRWRHGFVCDRLRGGGQ